MSYRPIFYDTETTGVRPDKDRIIEIAAFDPIRNKTFEQLINPGCPIPPDASAIHNITDEMVANAPPFKKVAEAFNEFCEGSVVLIAHNNDNFDFPFLKTEFARAETPFPPCKSFDTLKWARRYRADLPRHTLQILREHYGIPANNAHRALDDVIVLHQVYTFMTDDLSIEQVLDLLHSPRDILQMPFGKHQGQPLQNLPKDYVSWLSKSGALDKQENQNLKQSFMKLGLLAV